MTEKYGPGNNELNLTDQDVLLLKIFFDSFPEYKFDAEFGSNYDEFIHYQSGIGLSLFCSFIQDRIKKEKFDDDLKSRFIKEFEKLCIKGSFALLNRIQVEPIEGYFYPGSILNSVLLDDMKPNFKKNYRAWHSKMQELGELK